MGEARVRDAVLQLLLGGAVSPFVAPTRTVTTPPAAPLRFSAYDRHVIERAASMDDVPAVLASPALGNGIRLTKAEAVALAAQLGELPVPRTAKIDALLAKLVEHGVLR
jgi:hypothetical protein